MSLQYRFLFNAIMCGLTRQDNVDVPCKTIFDGMSVFFPFLSLLWQVAITRRNYCMISVTHSNSNTVLLCSFDICAFTQVGLALLSTLRCYSYYKAYSFSISSILSCILLTLVSNMLKFKALWLVENYSFTHFIAHFSIGMEIWIRSGVAFLWGHQDE